MNKTIALVGVPNCGKTTFWNSITGKSGKIGNWSGVTIEKFSAPILSSPDVELVDLPGIYSLSGENPEEKVAMSFLNSKNADCVIILIDGTNPEPGLYLALEILSLNIPAVMAVNFYDELQKNNISVDLKKLSENLGIPVFLISAFKKYNITPLISAAKRAVPRKKLPHFSCEQRHNKSSELSNDCFTSNSKSINHTSLFLLPGFCVLIFLVFVTASVLKNIFNMFFENLAALICTFLNYISAPQIMISLFTEGVINGISTVFSFVPELFAIFLAFAFLESGGYMARFAFFADYLFRKIGLSGASIIPLLIGFGCTVPAIYSLKSSENEHAQQKTLSSLMFIPCSARLPLSLLVCEFVFPVLKKIALLFFYLTVLIIGAIFSSVNNKTSSHFIIELPKIRIPSVYSVLKTGWMRTEFFIKKASFVIVLTSVLIWILKSFTPDLKPAEIFSESMLFKTADLVLPIFSPIGIPLEGVVALFFGLFSKESSLSALLSLVSNPISVFSPLNAISFLLFYLIYSPCSSALFAISHEFGFKKAAWLCIRQIAIAYLISFSFFQTAILLKIFSTCELRP